MGPAPRTSPVAGGDERGPLLRRPRRDRLALWQQRGSHVASGVEGAERVGAARHAGERVGVDAGLARGLFGRRGDGPTGSRVGLGPDGPGQRLARQRQVLPGAVSPQPLARVPGIRPSRLLANDHADPSRGSTAGSNDAGRDPATPLDVRSGRTMAGTAASRCAESSRGERCRLGNPGETRWPSAGES